MTGPRIVYDDATVLPSVGTFCRAEEGKTRQEEAAQADINKILRRLEDGSISPAMREGIFADVSSIGDFREAKEKVQRAEEAFSSLPASVRNRFANDPVQFVEAFGSEDGIKVLRECGVVAEPEDVVLDRQEGAREGRAERRRLERERVARVKAAEEPPK